MNGLHIDFNAPLNDIDSEVQTYGCRQNNPDICGCIVHVLQILSNKHHWVTPFCRNKKVTDYA